MNIPIELNACKNFKDCMVATFSKSLKEGALMRLTPIIPKALKTIKLINSNINRIKTCFMGA